MLRIQMFRSIAFGVCLAAGACSVESVGGDKPLNLSDILDDKADSDGYNYPSTQLVTGSWTSSNFAGNPKCYSTGGEPVEVACPGTQEAAFQSLDFYVQDGGLWFRGVTWDGRYVQGAVVVFPDVVKLVGNVVEFAVDTAVAVADFAIDLAIDGYYLVRDGANAFYRVVIKPIIDNLCTSVDQPGCDPSAGRSPYTLDSRTGERIEAP